MLDHIKSKEFETGKIKSLNKHLISGVLKIPNGTKLLPENLFKNNKDIIKVIIPSSLKIISEGCFNGCISLKEIEFSYSIYYNSSKNNSSDIVGLEEIGARAFYKCDSLNDIILPDSVKKIGNYAFFGTNITNIHIPSNILEIGHDAFNAKSSVRSLDLPNSLTKVGSNAFKGWDNLEKISMPKFFGKGLGYIFEEADLFYKNTDPSKYFISGYLIPSSIKELTITGNINKIPDYMFSHLTSLERINLPNSIITIGDFAFNECTNLKEINLDSDITVIGASAFSGCKSLTEVLLPNTINEIKRYAFKECTLLKCIKLPKGITKVEEGAFFACDSLREIRIPSSVKYIGFLAFSECKELKEVYLDKNINEIEESAFLNSKNVLIKTNITNHILPKTWHFNRYNDYDDKIIWDD